MTQAPTPGPLSGDDWTAHDGGECPFEHGTIIDVRYGDGEEQKSVTLHKGHGSWAYGPDGIHETDVVAYRIVSAPTAPVEASGSERERLSTIRELHAAEVLIDQQAAEIRQLKGLRPQPSGETREALDRLKMAAHVYEDDEMAADCATLEALLSARPLALGGQQGVQERCQRCGGEVQGWLCQSCPAEFRENDDGHLVFDEDTTPARAEAQDEGAAGEPVAWRWKANRTHPILGHATNEMNWNVTTGHPGFKIEGGLDPAWFDVQPLYAHPSPTPAADADRVREAMKTVLDKIDLQPGDYEAFLESVKKEMGKGAGK